MRRWVRGFFLLALVPAATAQDPQKAPYVERVEVRVRSVLVFITDAKGKALATPPAPQDLKVLEDGKAVEVLAIEPARRSAALPIGNGAGGVSSRSCLMRGSR